MSEDINKITERIITGHTTGHQRQIRFQLKDQQRLSQLRSRPIICYTHKIATKDVSICQADDVNIHQLQQLNPSQLGQVLVLNQLNLDFHYQQKCRAQLKIIQPAVLVSHRRLNGLFLMILPQIVRLVKVLASFQILQSRLGIRILSQPQDPKTLD